MACAAERDADTLLNDQERGNKYTHGVAAYEDMMQRRTVRQEEQCVHHWTEISETD